MLRPYFSNCGFAIVERTRTTHCTDATSSRQSSVSARVPLLSSSSSSRCDLGRETYLHLYQYNRSIGSRDDRPQILHLRVHDKGAKCMVLETFSRPIL